MDNTPPDKTHPNESSHSKSNHSKSHRPLKPIIINAVGFQLGWFGCVIGGDNYAPLTALIFLFIHKQLVMKNQREWLLMASITLIGVGTDSILTFLGILEWDAPYWLPIPLWLLCLWIIFSTTLKHSLAWLGRHWSIAPVLGFIAGPCSYWSGSALSDVTLRSPLLMTLVIIGGCWALLLTLFTKLSKTL